jgi:hypothetical protein
LQHRLWMCPGWGESDWGVHFGRFHWGHTLFS